MCGLVGIVGEINKKERDAFESLLIVDVLRGPHSTGIMSANSAGETKIFKKAALPLDLMDMSGYSRAVHYCPHVLMGHNRWATKGAVNSTNAHPFEHGNIVGAHNGTLETQSLLPESHQFPVDSDNLIYAIDKLGIKGAIALTHGAWALSLYDKEQRELHLLRNDKRPLYYVYGEKMEFMAWASEPWMLTGMLGRNGLKTKGKPKEIKTGHLYTFKLPKLRTGEIPLAQVSQLKEYEPPKQSYTSRTVAPFRGKAPETSGGVKAGDIVKFYSMGMDSTIPSRPFLEGVLFKQYGNTVARVYGAQSHLDSLDDWGGALEGKVSSVSKPYYTDSFKAYISIDAGSIKQCGSYEVDDEVLLGPNGVEVTPKAFDTLTMDGCSLCGCNLLAGDLIHWENNDPLCEDCTQTYLMDTTCLGMNYNH